MAPATSVSRQVAARTKASQTVSCDDALLVTAAQRGQADAFSALVDRYHNKVFGIVYRMCGPAEAEDLTQDIFLRALTALRKFQFKGEASFRTWLYRIAVNACINELRRRKRRYQLEGPSLDETMESGSLAREVPDLSRQPHEVIECRELQGVVQSIIQTLSPHHRAVIALIDLEGVDYEEAARVIGCPLGTLKSRLARARQAFGRKLRRYAEVVSA